MNDEAIKIDSSLPIKKTVIWLHGLGADGNDFVSIIPELALPLSFGVRFIFPHAPVMPVTVNNGYYMRAWYDIYGFALADKIDHEGILHSCELIQDLIKQAKQEGIKESDIILGGFSQGAVMALITGLTYPKSLGGIIALSGYLPAPNLFLEKAAEANQQIPIYMAHGTEDPVVPYALGRMAYSILEKAGYAVTWESFPMPHTVCKEEIAGISAFIQK
jgi:phospholipase/carboxylesterase